MILVKIIFLTLCIPSKKKIHYYYFDRFGYVIYKRFKFGLNPFK